MTDLMIRKTEERDVDRVMEIYASARERMHAGGNVHQWVNRPFRSTVEEDVRRGTGYVMTDKDGVIRAAFAFILGADPTYALIEDGAWLNDEPYGTVHRIAGDGTAHGVLRQALTFCAGLTDNIRIDTHEDNAPMRHLMDELGFTRCGIIYVEDDMSDHSPRIAYQKVLKEKMQNRPEA